MSIAPPPRPPRRRLLAAAAGLAAAATLPGCAGLRAPPTRVPMAVTRLAAPCRADTLVVLLPGALSAPREFVDEGWIRALHDERRLAADAWLVDAHPGYYLERSILQRLREDVLVPARAAGYARVWLAGISLGGFGALGCAARHPGEVDGVLAVAPYLGRRSLLKEIGDAGGPRRWRADVPPPRPGQDDDLEREVWRMLAGGDTARLFLGHGREDRFAGAQRVAAALLGDRGFSVPGGHDWPAWRPLWAQWLDRGLLAPRCAADPASTRELPRGRPGGLAPGR
ncbi:hypothetical protein ISF6_2321 [Piscinibacter sakaiensis]|uniref:Acyl-CoA:diacylglycerol acyltransferase n=1 Tax=Piscinibacter sakaiensis TaxID=1547922 RepID=A0A0K8P1H4_PISS1|nr:hypothetical protein ISF6_2321 [Piscinibacter sakaiensis]